MASPGNSNLLQLGTDAIPKNVRIVLVKTEWNANIVDELEAGCRRVFKENEVEDVCTITVPGAVEIPFAIKSYWEAKKYGENRPHAFIATGCVIKGDTPHFDYVCKAVTEGILSLNLQLPVPVIFGILTVDNEAQANERIGGKHGHKGEEAGITALKMISLQLSFK